MERTTSNLHYCVPRHHVPRRQGFDNAWFQRQRVVYIKSKPAWDVTATDIPNFDMMPPSPPKQ
jgi:hypothetical protein